MQYSLVLVGTISSDTLTKIINILRLHKLRMSGDTETGEAMFSVLLNHEREGVFENEKMLMESLHALPGIKHVGFCRGDMPHKKVTTNHTRKARRA